MTLFLSAPKITNFATLGDGRKRREVAIVESETNRILAIPRVRKNHACHKLVEFDNRQTFYMTTETYRGQKVDLYFPNPRIVDEFEKQKELENLQTELPKMKPQDVLAFYRLLLELLGRQVAFQLSEQLVAYYLIDLRSLLYLLSLRELRSFRGLL